MVYAHVLPRCLALAKSVGASEYAGSVYADNTESGETGSGDGCRAGAGYRRNKDRAAIIILKIGEPPSETGGT